MTALIPARTLPQSPARKLSRYAIYLITLFILSLPLANPWVRGDGVGYYAYVRSLLIDHDLHFDKDWLAANQSFAEGRVAVDGHLRADQYSPTGYVGNHFSIGPSILWAPFLIATHSIVLLADRLGAHVAADGYSRPYLITMAAATALYGFFGLLLAFDLARHYVDERWAFLATLGIWFGSSLPVYMYFNPSWSHAHSAFAVALFLWYWHRTRSNRTLGQWFLLGLTAGLMVNVYYPNAILLLVPALDAPTYYLRAVRETDKKPPSASGFLSGHVLFIVVAGLALLPTFLTRKIIYGSSFESGYPPIREWFWTSPKLLAVLVSADHGMLSWTPILIFALLGLIVFWRRDHVFGSGLIVVFLTYYYFIASYPDWDGISSFGNRFFVSLTPVFILGLAAALEWFAIWWNAPGRDLMVASVVFGILVLWNFGLIFQWGSHLVPVRGPISFSQMAQNQFWVVPRELTAQVRYYVFERKAMMQKIEERDLKQLHAHSPQP